MNKAKVIALTVIALFVCILMADEIIQPAGKKTSSPTSYHSFSPVLTRETPDYEFSVNPTPLNPSYFDYVIGGYYNLPMQIQPSEFGNDIYLTYHAKTTLSGQRRVYYSRINGGTNAVEFNELITPTVNYEGYSCMAFDPASGKIILAWHEHGVTETIYDVKITWDAFLNNTPGNLFPPQMIIDNPTTLISGTTTTIDNQFMWPIVAIGPSPVEGNRRVYISTRNMTNHNTYLTQNTYIGYADFTTQMVQDGTPLTWTFTSVPLLDAWSLDTQLYRFPYLDFVAGDDGRIYLIGYHDQINPDGTFIMENGMDCFINDNYGAGPWRYISANAFIPAWNPPLNDGSGGYLFNDIQGNALPDSALFWWFGNNEHANAVYDQTSQKVHFPSLMTLCRSDGNYYNYLQFVRHIVFDTETETFSTKQVYPKGANLSGPFTPWDQNDDHVVDQYNAEGIPIMKTIWPFSLWEDQVNMMPAYTNMKITEPNEHGQMAMVWQDSWKARMYRLYPDEYPDLAPYNDAPEIYISLSNDYGDTWYDPIALSSVTNPELAGIIPMYVYPANKLIYRESENEGARLYILFFDDNSWGSYPLNPDMYPNDGGTVMYMAIDLTTVGNDDMVQPPSIATLQQNFPNPFNPQTTITFNLSKAAPVDLAVYNTKGQIVKSLLKEMAKQGDHSVDWNGTDKNGNPVSSGVYFYRLNNGKTSQSRKMVLMR
jgi:hypothetical protein